MALMQLEKPKKRAFIKRLITPALSNEYVVVDFPKNGEKILPVHYAFRIGANQENIEISMDGGEWKSCRKGSGYFWYDWNSIPAGKHKCAARMKLTNGKYKKSKSVAFMTVVPELN